MAATALLAVAAPASAQVVRTTYVTATDARGAFVADLTAADLTVNEAGRAGAITHVERSTAPMHIAILYGERLAADTAVRSAIVEFVRLMRDQANVALYLIRRRNEMVVDYTTDLDRIMRGLEATPLALRRDEQGDFLDGLQDVARSMRQIPRGRRVIVALAIDGSSGDPGATRLTMEELRMSGVMLYTAVLTDFSLPSNQVLADSPRQSGGRREDALLTARFRAILDGFAEELRHQYAVTYELPSGVRLNGSLRVESRRAGVTVRAPTRVPTE